MICVALWGAGCRDKEVVALERIQGEVCACTTSACAEAALAGIPKADNSSTPKTQALARKILDCVARIYEAEKASKEAPDDEPVTPPQDPLPGASGSSAPGSAASGSG